MKSITTGILLLILNKEVMAHEINTEILINASPDKIWKILSNFDAYPTWNPFIKSIKGQVALKNKIVVRIEPPEANGMTFKPKILAFEANQELRWLGHLLFPGIFDGEHTFKLIDNGDGTTTFRQNEKFRGILVPLFKKQLDNNTKKGFEEMNKKLKELAEKK